MPINRIMQLNELIGRWDVVATDSKVSQLSQNNSPEQAAYLGGVALAMELARDELTEVLATLLKEIATGSEICGQRSSQ